MSEPKRRKSGWVKGVLSAAIFAGAAAIVANQAGIDIFSKSETTPPPINDNSQTQLTEREHRTISLPNGLDVLLTHDPQADKSAAAMAVGVGFIDDPKTSPGLAHYLEHMLFLGTEQFPVTGSYGKYLSANGGGNNAYTTMDHTNYFFEIRHEGFDEAMDRFSDFFKAPLFDVSYAEKEIKAVDEEFNARLRSDGSRRAYVQSMISEAGHPIQQFGIGNKQTLGNGYNQETLKAFYDSFYAASNMKLSVISNLSLDKQEAMIREHFEAIPDFEVTHAKIDPTFRKPLLDHYRLLEVKSITDVRVMSLDFPTIQLDEDGGAAPAWVIGSIIGYEGKGSLLSKLKEEGLADSISARGSSVHPELHSMGISIGLTPKGMEDQDRVLELVFSYIDMLKAHGIEHYSFDEMKAMTQIGYQWQSPGEGSSYANLYSRLMLSYELDELHTSPFLITDYSPNLYKMVLDTMSPQNMMVTILAQDVNTNQTAPYYGTEYAVSQIGGSSFENLANPPRAADEGMLYPQKNEFIPYNLKLQPLDSDTKLQNATPHLVIDSDIAQVWSQFDTRFNQPKANITLNIESPVIYDTVENFIKASLLEGCINEGMSEQVYPLQMAGLGYQVSIGRHAVQIELNGYTERFDELTSLISQNMTACNISEESFELIKDRFVRSLLNDQLGSASDRASRYSSLLQINIHSNEEKLRAAAQVTLADVKEYASKIFERVYITGSAYGNLNDENVRDIVEQFTTQLGSAPLPLDERPTVIFSDINPGEDIIFSAKVPDNNNALLYTVQAGEKNTRRLATLQLISALVRNDFYTQLRTNQQLGYVVQSYPQSTEDTLSMNFMIQSRYGPVKLQVEVENWMNSAMNIFDTMSDAEFESFKLGLAANYQSQNDNIRDVNKQNFARVALNEANFEYLNEIAQITKDLTREEVKAMAAEIFTNPDAPTLAIHIRSEKNDNPVPEDAFTTVEQFKSRGALAP